jgi:indolepyruvate ferredoxin oxidoreductase
MPGEFTRNVNFSLPTERLKRAIVKAAGAERTTFFDATRAATQLFGNAIAANMFMLGMASQKGALPLSPETVEEAIRLNGAGGGDEHCGISLGP